MFSKRRFEKTPDLGRSVFGVPASGGFRARPPEGGIQNQGFPSNRKAYWAATLLAVGMGMSSLMAAPVELPDLRSVKPDLETPAMTSSEPLAGRRVRQTTPGWEGSDVHHALYLPREWRPGKTFPVIVEYAGNGGYQNKFGDVSRGTVEGSQLGYGMSGGEGFLWVCLPFVQVTGERRENCPLWWGDVAETKRYCTNTVRFICERYGGDPRRVVLAGFSRGAIAANFIGLHDEQIAKVWRAFVCYSHYDGVNTNWPYVGADRISALTRLQRLGNRPQFICHEGDVSFIRDHVQGTGAKGNFTFATVPFRNHSDQWVLRETLERRKLRDWLKRELTD
jgi:hypothetical protein